MTNEVMKIPNITLELIENCKVNPSILKESNVLTQYIIAKCLSRDLADEHQLKIYINELEETKAFQCFLSEINISQGSEGYLGTARFFENTFQPSQKYRFVGRKSTIKNIDNFVKNGKTNSKNEQSNVLLIIGEPGSGKTSLMRHYLKDMRNEYAHYFIEPKTRDLCNPKIFLKHIDLFFRNKHGIKASGQSSETGEILDRLTKLLSDIAETKLGDKDIETIFVDGLDNSVNGVTHKDFDIASVITDLFSNHFNNKIKIVITSRDRELLEQLRRLSNKNVVLLNKDKENEKDIKTFLNEVTKYKLPKILTQNILQKIEGNFLCAALWIDQVNMLSLNELEKALDKIPTGLDGIYDLMISNLENNKTQAEKRMIRDALRIIAITPEKLTPEQVLNFCQIDYFDKDQVFNSMEQFFDINEYKHKGLCKYHHIYFEEYIKRNIRDEKKYHKRIAIYFENKYEKNWEKLDDNYGLNWLTYHYLYAGDYSKLIALMENGFLQTKLRRKGIHAWLLPDISRAIQAAKYLGDLGAGFKYAVLYTDFKTRQISGIRKNLIPLYARLGEIDTATEMSDALEIPSERAIAYAQIANNLVKTNPDQAKIFTKKCLNLFDEFPTCELDRKKILLDIVKEICTIDLEQAKLIVSKAKLSTVEYWQNIFLICEKLSKFDLKICFSFIKWLKRKHKSEMPLIISDYLPQIFEQKPEIIFRIINDAHHRLPTFYKIAMTKLPGKSANEVIQFTKILMKKPSLLNWYYPEACELFQFLADNITKKTINNHSHHLILKQFKHPFFCEEIRIAFVRAYVNRNSNEIDSMVEQIQHPYFYLKTLLILYQAERKDINISKLFSTLSKIKEGYFRFSGIKLVLQFAKKLEENSRDKLFAKTVDFAEKKGMLLQTLAEFADVNIPISISIMEKICENDFLQDEDIEYITDSLSLIITKILENKNKKYNKRILHIFEKVQKAILKQSNDESFVDTYLEKLGVHLAKLQWKHAWTWINFIQEDYHKKRLYAAIVEGMRAGRFSKKDWNRLQDEVLNCKREHSIFGQNILEVFVGAVADISPDDALALIDRFMENETRIALYQSAASAICRKDLHSGLKFIKKYKNYDYISEALFCISPSWFESLNNPHNYFNQAKITIERIYNSSLKQSEKENFIASFIAEIAKKYDVKESIKLMRQYLPSEKLFPLNELLNSKSSSHLENVRSVENVVRVLVRLDPERFVSHINSEHLNLLKGRIPQIMTQEIVELEDALAFKLCIRLITLFEEESSNNEDWEALYEKILEHVMNEMLKQNPRQAEKIILGITNKSLHFKGLISLARIAAIKGNLKKALEYVDMVKGNSCNSTNIMEVIIRSVPSNRETINELYDIIKKKYAKSDEDREQIITEFIPRYITVDTKTAMKLIKNLSIYERMWTYGNAIRACSNNKQENIEKLLGELLKEIHCITQAKKTSKQFQFHANIISQFSTLCSKYLKDKNKIKTLLLECIIIAKRIKILEIKQETLTAISIVLLKFDLDKSLEIFRDLEHRNKMRMLGKLAEIDTRKTLDLFDEFYIGDDFGEKHPIILLDKDSEQVIKSLIENGDLSVDELIKIDKKYLLHSFVDPIEKAIEKMNKENIPLRKVLKMIEKYDNPKLYRKMIPRLANEKSLDDALKIIKDLKPHTQKFTEELRRDLIAKVIFESTDKCPKTAIKEIHHLNRNEQAGLLLDVAEKLWDRDKDFAQKTLSKSEELAKKHFYSSSKNDFSNVMKFKLEKAQTVPEIIDIISIAVEFEDTFEQTMNITVASVARINGFKALNEFFNAIHAADRFIQNS